MKFLLRQRFEQKWRKIFGKRYKNGNKLVGDQALSHTGEARFKKPQSRNFGDFKDFLDFYE
jgi:hypothetical protein